VPVSFTFAVAFFLKILKYMQQKTGGYLALATTSVLWGTTWVASKIGVGAMPAFQMAAIRQLLAGICFVGFFAFYKKLQLPSFKQFKFILWLSLLMFVGANGLSTWSLNYIPTGLSSLIGALYPISVVAIEMLVFKNRQVNGLTFAGLLLGIGGTGIVFYENAFSGTHHPDFYFGVLLSVGAMLSWSIGTMVIARNRVAINPYYATGWQMIIGSAVLFTIAYTGQPTIALQQVSITAWAAIAYLVVAGSLISYAAFIYSMKKLPAALFSLYAYFNPLVAMLVAGWLLGEPLNINIFWGAVVTLGGVYLVNYSIKKQGEKQKQ
jgi:drug/metabolite transporter (DMT)-like permease